MDVCLEEYRLVGHGRHLDQGLLTRLSAGHHLETHPLNDSAVSSASSSVLLEMVGVCWAV